MNITFHLQVKSLRNMYSNWIKENTIYAIFKVDLRYAFKITSGKIFERLGISFGPKEN